MAEEIVPLARHRACTSASERTSRSRTANSSPPRRHARWRLPAKSSGGWRPPSALYRPPHAPVVVNQFEIIAIKKQQCRGLMIDFILHQLGERVTKGGAVSRPVNGSCNELRNSCAFWPAAGAASPPFPQQAVKVGRKDGTPRYAPPAPAGSGGFHVYHARPQ